MRISVCSDEAYPVHGVIIRDLEQRGHEVVRYGSFQKHESAQPWALVAEEAAQAVASGMCEQGIFFCWTGTGISIAANKVAGIRAALCVDAGTAKGARIWNHANVLCLSNRLLSEDIAKEILQAWFQTPEDERGREGVSFLETVERRHRAS
jgi:ribose 5-phosphate isomerase B